MTHEQPSRPAAPHRLRKWFSLRRLLLVAVPAIGIAAIAVFFLPGLSHSSQDSGPMMHKVEAGEFAHDITERGDLESANNVEIRCEVKSTGYSGTTILEIIPEGTIVQPGDILVKLDSASLENERTQEQIAVANSEAEVIKARTAFATAQVALEEYKEGLYKQNLDQAQSDVYVAKENLRRAEEYYGYSKMLEKKGYITSSQLDADRFAAEKAKKDLEAALTKQMVLEEYTKKKMERQLKSDIEAAEAHLNAQLHSNELELQKLALLEMQLEKCIIRAPCAGQVVYVNVTNGWGGREIIIEAGSTVRERQEIIRLPDHNQMQVKARINEAKVALVAVGMPATVRLDAFPEMELEGVVERVNEYPAPNGRFSSSVKEYETTIHLINPPPGARPGLTAEVKIHVEHVTKAIQVPVQAIFEHGPKEYAVIREEDGYRAQEVKIGSTNDKFVVIKEGLQEGQEIVLNAAAYRAKVQLPELPPDKPTPTQVAGRERSAKAALVTAVAAHRGLNDTPAKSPRIALSDPNPAAVVERVFSQYDKNKDGRIELASLPEALRAQLAFADVNKDGTINRAELLASLVKMAAREHASRHRAAGGGQ